ncbi:MAG: glycine--tRNA ligase [Bacteroidales bacterium]|nr:glycine--tRNA ligase [Bacteroidales bacterium]MCF8327005.1 glycine--tRNA ligase [Bacteroidales bacterium]
MGKGNSEDFFKKIIAHAKEYGFIFQSSEIYDGLSAAYDYGPFGVELKNNIKDYWWKSMVQYHENIVGLDSAIFMHPSTWKASGHLEAFNDPMIDNKDSKKRYRADELIEDHLDKIEKKIDKEIKKAAKRFGDDFDEDQFRSTHPKVLKYTEKIEAIKNRMNNALENEQLDELKKLIEEENITCPVSGSANWTDVRQFNLMFSTELGSTSENNKIYLRPETAQGIFVNYLNVQKTGRMKLPFGIAQIGKAFRNEIVARQFIFRMREFEQMELQYFVQPGTEMEWLEYWKNERVKWHKALGIDDDFFRLYEHEKLAHYANAAYDIEFDFPFGFKELEGIHSRTDFDLSAHQEHSGKKLQYYDPETQESYVPYVVETSIGLDRMFLAVLTAAYKEEKLQDNSERVVLKIPPILSPYKAAVFPLTKKDGLPEKGREVMDKLKFNFMCQYEEKDTIGKRYRRHDAIGTPYCITVDHQTLEDNTVTIRERDSMEQERVEIDRLQEIIQKRLSM